MTKNIVYRSARVFDGESEALCIGVNVFVQGGVISEISGRPAGAEDEVVDCGGRVLMPGLLDAHVHVYAAGLNIVRVAQSPMSCAQAVTSDKREAQDRIAAMILPNCETENGTLAA